VQKTKLMAGIKTYIQESYTELVQKVSWPTWSELQESTVLVFITTAVLSLAIFLMDAIFGVGNIFGYKGLVGTLYSIL
jgi:preprotein translocase subunit SecE